MEPESESLAQRNEALPELLTEFMVDMNCQSCVFAVKNKLLALEGVKSIDVDLSYQVVRVLGSSPVTSMLDALQQTGRNARLIGQGIREDFQIAAAVAEFKGPDVFGIVRIAQVSSGLVRIEANFSGLTPGKHRWSINEFGDLTRGVASTGNVFNSGGEAVSAEALGDLGTLEAGGNGEAQFSSSRMLRVADLIGRSVAVYAAADRSDAGVAAVIARSAAVGENYKKLCACDGSTIWEA